MSKSSKISIGSCYKECPAVSKTTSINDKNIVTLSHDIITLVSTVFTRLT